MLDGRQAVFLIKEEGTQSVRNLSAVGRRVPAHGTAVGKAILAFLPREETLRRLEGARLERLTPRTMTNVEDLLADLDRTVERRYSIDDEESNPEVCCLGVPIRNEHGAVIAGMSVSVHRSQMTPAVPRAAGPAADSGGRPAVPPHGPPAGAAPGRPGRPKRTKTRPGHGLKTEKTRALAAFRNSRGRLQRHTERQVMTQAWPYAVLRIRDGDCPGGR